MGESGDGTQGGNQGGDNNGFSAQARALFARANKFHSTTVQANAARWELTDRASNQGAMREAAKLGFTGIEVDPDRGGLGLDVREKLRVAEILGRSSVSFALGLFSSQNVAVKLATLGSDRHRSDLLPGLLAGTRFGTIAVCDPGASTTDTLASTTTTAKKNSKGWVLSGDKTWLVNAAVADVFLCYVQTGEPGDPEGLACFVVRSNQVGVKVSSPYRLVAGAPIGIGEISLDDYQADDVDMIISPGEATGAAIADLNGSRLELATLCCSAARAGLGRAVDHRWTAGSGPIGAADSEAMADAVTALDAAEALVSRALGDFRADPSARRTSLTVAQAKKFACATGEVALTVAHRQLGREGLREDDPTGRLLAECRVTRELAGNDSDLAEEIAGHLGSFFSSAASDDVTVAKSPVTPDGAGTDEVVDIRDSDSRRRPSRPSGRPTVPRTASPSPAAASVAPVSSEPSAPAVPSMPTVPPMPSGPPMPSTPPVPAVPPMPPQVNRLEAAAAADPSSDDDQPDRSMPPMPPPGLKRADS